MNSNIDDISNYMYTERTKNNETMNHIQNAHTLTIFIIDKNLQILVSFTEKTSRA